MPASPWQVRGREERPLKLRFLQGVGRPPSPTSSKAPTPRVLPARTRPACRPSSACPSEQALALPCTLQRGGSEGTEGLAGSGEGLQWASTPGCRPPPRGSPPPPPPAWPPQLSSAQPRGETGVQSTSAGSPHSVSAMQRCVYPANTLEGEQETHGTRTSHKRQLERNQETPHTLQHVKPNN